MAAGNMGKQRKRARTLRAFKVSERAPDYGTSGIVWYQASDGKVSLDVRLDRETLWLNLNQMATLFRRDNSVISRHLGNVFKTKELERDSTVAFFATVQDEGGRAVKRQVEYYNLDAIISVGYRVNSKRGTQFRVWATGVLGDHILKRYSANEKRLKELKQAIRLVADVVARHELAGDQAGALLRVVADYSFALDVLDDYDHKRLAPPEMQEGAATALEYDEALRIVDWLREKYGGSSIFGREKDQSLRSSLGAIMQSVDGRDAYPGVEAKAANLLYRSRTIPSWTATSASARHSSSGFSRKMECSTCRTETAGCPRVPW
jgi:hypothetical protein